MKRILYFIGVVVMLLIAACKEPHDNMGYPTKLTVSGDGDTILLPSNGILSWDIVDKNGKGVISTDKGVITDNGFINTDGEEPESTPGIQHGYNGSMTFYKWLKVTAIRGDEYDSIIASPNYLKKEQRTLYIRPSNIKWNDPEFVDVEIKVVQTK